jgi:gas vesicle protein
VTDDDQERYDDELDDFEIVEEEDDEMDDTGFRGPEFATGLILGAALGAVIALLAAPHTGARTRRDLGRKARRIRHGVEDRWDGVHRDVRRKVRRRKRKIRGQVEQATKRTRKAIGRLT